VVNGRGGFHSPLGSVTLLVRTPDMEAGGE
jgi:hypothetical protein